MNDSSVAAHPWHSAQPGEGWVIEIGFGYLANWQAVVVSNGGRFLYRDGGSTPVDASFIRAGHRTFPRTDEAGPHDTVTDAERREAVHRAVRAGIESIIEGTAERDLVRAVATQVLAIEALA